MLPLSSRTNPLAGLDARPLPMNIAGTLDASRAGAASRRAATPRLDTRRLTTQPGVGSRIRGSAGRPSAPEYRAGRGAETVPRLGFQQDLSWTCNVTRRRAEITGSEATWRQYERCLNRAERRSRGLR